MFFLYRATIGFLFYCSLPILLLLVIITGRHREGLSQRLGLYPHLSTKKKEGKTVWIHAASVGEVQAARAVLVELQKRLPAARYVLTTMTVQGKRIAERQLGEHVACYLAPLDVPGIVNLVVRRINPDLYICIETELWPLLLYTLSRRKVRICMVNGRMSERSYGSYLKIQRLLKDIVKLFDRMAVISQSDREKYLSLGADQYCVTVEGNLKYDLAIPENCDEVRDYFCNIMAIDGEEVFVAGSTHTGEEAMILSLLRKDRQERKSLVIIAPRHVERIPEIEKIVIAENVGYQLMSDLEQGEERKETLILVDTMGQLSQLYSIADFIFCGGSLVERGGHNLMEAALWHKAVFYGPSIDDFQDAADLLESVKGGYQVDSFADLENRLCYFRKYPTEYSEACQRAGDIAMRQQGCSGRQVDFILDTSVGTS